MIAYTVPGYRRVLDHAGLGELADRVMKAGSEGRRGEARDLIDDGYLDRLAVIVGDDLEDAIESWRPLTDQITLSVPWYGPGDADQLAQTERLIERIRGLRRF
jgi:hypothetical protein